MGEMCGRWQRSNGADFVFYDPHPGFTDGTAEKEYYRLICDTFQHAMHIVVERGQRNICKVSFLELTQQSHSWFINSFLCLSRVHISPAELAACTRREAHTVKYCKPYLGQHLAAAVKSLCDIMKLATCCAGMPR